MDIEKSRETIPLDDSLLTVGSTILRIQKWKGDSLVAVQILKFDVQSNFFSRFRYAAHFLLFQRDERQSTTLFSIGKKVAGRHIVIVMRDTLEPIRRNAYVSEDEEDDEERDRRRRAAWNIRPEGTSNDSDDIRTSISIDNGFPVRFSCEDFVDESLEQKPIDLQFAYEVTVSGIGTTSFADNMRALEWSILWNVVKELDLHRCDFTRQDALVERARRVPPTRLLQSTGPSYVVALGSGSSDKVDLAVGTIHSLCYPCILCSFSLLD